MLILYLVPHPYQGHVVFQAGGTCMQTDLMSVVVEFREDTSSSAAQRAPPETPDLYLINISAEKQTKITWKPHEKHMLFSRPAGDRNANDINQNWKCALSAAKVACFYH